MNHFGSNLLAHLALIGDRATLTTIGVFHDGYSLAAHNFLDPAFFDSIPFGKIPVPAIKVGLLVGLKTFLFEFATELAARHPIWALFQKFRHPKLGFIRLARHLSILSQMIMFEQGLGRVGVFAA
jgi:hypothetical protein